MIQSDNPSLHEAFASNNRRHILMITNHGIHQWNVIPGLPDTGGQNVFVNQFTEALARFGFRITIVNRGGYAHPVTGEMHTGIRYRDENQRIIYVEDGLDRFVRKEDMAQQIPALVDHLDSVLTQEQSQVDLIISHYWDAAVLGNLYNQRRAVPLKHIWAPHSLGFIKKRNEQAERWDDLRIDERIDSERALLREVDGVAATSSTIAKSLTEEFGYSGPILFLPPCINPYRYFPRHHIGKDEKVWDFLAERSGLPREEVQLCQIVTEISRTDETKRKNVLLEAFARVHREMPKTLLVLSIDEHREAAARQLHAQIEALGIASHTAVVGSVWDWLPMIYGVTDIYCTPSVMEGFGISAQEAAATRVPVVASHLVPFVSEYLLGAEVEEIRGRGGSVLRRGSGAVVVEADDVVGFADALSLLLSNEPLRRQMGTNAYHITIPRFTWGHIVEGFINKIGIIEQQLRRPTLSHLLQHEAIEDLTPPQLVRAFLDDERLSEYLPDGICQFDPRNGDRILYSSARANRPADNRPLESGLALSERPCVVCQGQTTGVIDVASLGEGFTFVNKNLLPILYPRAVDDPRGGRDDVDPYAGFAGPEGVPSSGLHLLQWTSSIHSKDWHNMALADRVIVMQRLAVLERKLLELSGDGKPVFVSIIKNRGRLVGGSLVHGHQQIGVSNVLPRRLLENWRFEQQHGETFTSYLLRVNPPELLIRDYGPAVLLTPYFMRRPFDMMLVLRDTRKRQLFELEPDEIEAVAEGWHDAIRAMLWVMPRIGRETAYNVVTHNGPGAGLYFEFLPYTQELGGFEQLGLFVCQAEPRSSAETLREFVTSQLP